MGARCGQHNVESVMWTTQCGQHDMDNTLWTARYGQHNVDSAMWTTQRGQHNVDSAIWTTQCGQRDMDNTMWTARSRPRSLISHVRYPKEFAKFFQMYLVRQFPIGLQSLNTRQQEIRHSPDNFKTNRFTQTFQWAHDKRNGQHHE